jgi:hypothetical protein
MEEKMLPIRRVLITARCFVSDEQPTPEAAIFDLVHRMYPETEETQTDISIS